MAWIIKEYHLTAATLQGLTSGSQYYVSGPSGGLVNATVFTPATLSPPDSACFDLSQFQTVRAHVAAPTLTGSVGGVVQLDHIFPDTTVPGANLPNNSPEMESVTLATLTVSSAVWYNSTLGPYASNETTDKQTRFAKSAVRIFFSTSPVTAADMYILIVGYGWKSERND